MKFLISEPSHRSSHSLIVGLVVLPLALIVGSIVYTNEAQVISHDLRRLAVSTNQFGIDVLKIIDRNEPPDKVVVFCPICLSSSLAMIMMGSSKYQVVSSLRHALYVWSMKPSDVNNGFKDIFNFIGLNQQQASIKAHELSVNTEMNEPKSTDKIRSAWSSSEYDPEILMRRRTYIHELSLPMLMKLREPDEVSKVNNRLIHLDHSQAKARESSVYQGKLFHNAKHDTRHTNQTMSNPRGDNIGSDLSQMSTVSDIYMQRGLLMNYQYNIFLRNFYRTVVHPVDFSRRGEETRQHINSLIALNTEGKIKDLVAKTKFTNPKIMLITAFHFRGTLDVQVADRKRFHESSREDSGHSQANSKLDKLESRRKRSFIEIEPTLLKHNKFKNTDCSMIEIPFSNRLVSLLILMPNNANSTELFLSQLSAQVLKDMSDSLTVKKLSLEIPIIKFDRGPINMEGLMRGLGLDWLFFGDKPATSETGLNKWMRPSDIIHETSIDIGTYNTKSEHLDDRLTIGAHESRSNTASDKHIVLDKPFFYFVLDSINGLVLTMGRVRE